MRKVTCPVFRRFVDTRQVYFHEFRIANQPYAVDDAPPEEPPPSTKRTASDVLAAMNDEDQRAVAVQAAKRSRGSPHERELDEQSTSPVPSDTSSGTSADTVNDGDVAAVHHDPELTDVEAQRYVKAVLDHMASGAHQQKGNRGLHPGHSRGLPGSCRLLG